MYRELGIFSYRVLRQKAILGSGEFITSLFVGVAFFIFFHFADEGDKYVRICHEHLGSLLTMASIIAVFSLFSFLHYIQIASTWKKDKKIQDAANKIVDWNAVTVLCILVLILYMILLLIFNDLLYEFDKAWRETAYSFLMFQIVYCLLQLFCHTLLLWFTFHKRDVINDE
jgi:cytochrome bd-type quinol oxidase subunit 2